MTIKYQVHNQLTGLPEEALTFENAKLLQEKIRNDYMDNIKDCFNISILIQNEDNSWTQSVADTEGNPIVPDIVEPNITE